jgi:Glycosyltransferase family 10 (fucosyltransferase) C-term
MKVYLHNHGKLEGAPYFPSLRQTYFSNGIVGNIVFSEDPSEEDEWIVLFGGTKFPASHLHIKKSKRILILMEHPAIWCPPDILLEEVGLIVCPFLIKTPKDSRLIIHHAAVTWFYGIHFRIDQGLSHVPILQNYLELQDFEKITLPKKNKLISCVVSSKRISPGHSWRIDFAETLKNYFGNEMDMWGFGWRPLHDKRDAIDPYKYTLVIENDLSEHYWTEKLSDAILGYSIPIYSGASKVQNYFKGEIPQIKYATDMDVALNSVKNRLSREYKTSDLYQNRNQILSEHNLYNLLERLITG